MITDEEINVYLEHHGVRGMRWGVRNAQSRVDVSVNKKHKQMDFGTKATIAGVLVSGAAFIVARKMMMKTPVAVALGAGAGIGTAALLERNHNKKIKDLGG